MSEADNSPETLEQSIWRDLPEDLILIVLSKLGFLTLVALRSVCKKWDKFILSRGQALDPAEYQMPVTAPIQCDPAEIGGQQLSFYNYKIRKWEKLSLSFSRGVDFKPFWENPGPYTLAAADGGLLCFRDSTFVNFVVCNPLTKTWKQLLPPNVHPPVSFCRWDCSTHDDDSNSNKNNKSTSTSNRNSEYVLVGMVVDSEVGTYKLVVAGLLPESITLVYDSSLQSWQLGAPVVLPTPLFNREFRCVQYNGKSVNLNENLYWLISEGHDLMSSVSVVKYDLEKDFWIATPPKIYPRGSLVRRYQGKMSVMTLDRAQVPRQWGGRQWILQVHETQSRFCLLSKRISEYSMWKIERLPRFCDHTLEYHCCVGQGDLIFIVYRIKSGSKALGYHAVIFDAFINSYINLPRLRQPSLKFPLLFSEVVEAETWWGFVPSLKAFV